jgi:preprotein translocase subunit Sec61beta
MTYDENQNSNLDIDPAMVVLGLGYATSLLVVIGWVASFVI